MTRLHSGVAAGNGTAGRGTSRLAAVGLCAAIAFFCGVGGLAGAGSGEGATVSERPAMPTAREVEKAVAAVYPALVNISAVSRDFSEGRAIRFPSAGSGVLVSEAGHVLTNFHVAGDSTRIRCTLTDGRIFDADVVAHDPLTDLSVLKLRAAAGGAPGASPAGGRERAGLTGLRPARLAVAAPVAIGDPVLALGNPFALSSSVTLGIVSNAHRVFTDFTGSELSDVELEGGEATGWLTQWIQHDALILAGNSGGPLVNLAGEVIGINELGGGGIGFAIPARVAADVLRHALADGTVRRSFLGFAALPVAKIGRETGALVSSVTPGGPAEAAGLVAGDILLALAGEAVEARFFEQVPELYRRVAGLPIGEPVTLRIERRGEVRDIVVRTQEMERLRGVRGELRALGISAEELTGPLALARNLRVREGVIVTGLRPGQAAATARPQVQVGDVLLAVNGQPVATLAAVTEQLAAAARTDTSAVSGAGPSVGNLVLKLLRSDQEILALVRLPESRNGRWGGELPRAWLGVQTQVLSPELAAALGRAGTRGYRVSEVYPWTNAERAGLAVGDLLIALDGEPLAASRPQDADDLRRAIEARRIGETLRLTIVREGRESVVAVQLESRPAASDETRKTKQDEFEFSVRELTLLDRSDRHWPRDQAGVLVTDVTSGGWAHMAGLRIDDLILSLNGGEIAGVADFERRVAELSAARAPSVEVFVRRGAGTHFVFIEPEWPEGRNK